MPLKSGGVFSHGDASDLGCTLMFYYALSERARAVLEARFERAAGRAGGGGQNSQGGFVGEKSQDTKDLECAVDLFQRLLAQRGFGGTLWRFGHCGGVVFQRAG